MKTTWRIGGVPEHFNMPWLLAIEHGAFEAQGLHVTWQDYPSGTGAQCEALERGDLDVAILLTEGVVAYQARGGAAKLVGTYVSTPLAWGVHVHAGSAAQTLDDVAGRPVAISRYGSGSHLMALLLADARGWPTPALHVVGGLEGAKEVLGSPSAEVFMWEQVMTKPLVDSGLWRCVDVFSAPWPAFVIAVRAELLEERCALARMLEVVRGQCEALRAAPDAVERISQRYGLSPEVVAPWLVRTQWRCTPGVELAAIEQVLDALEAADALGGVARPSSQSLLSPL